MKKTILKVIVISVFALLIFFKSHANTERDSLLNLLNKHKQEDTIRVNLLLDVAQTYWYNYKLSTPFIEEALAISNELSYTRGIVYSKATFVEHTREHLVDSSGVMANDILEISKAENFKQGICIAYSAFVEYHMWSRNFVLATEYFEKIKSECLEITDSNVMIYASIMASASYGLSGNINKAEECYNYAESFSNERKRKSIITKQYYWKSRLFSEVLMDYETSIEYNNKLHNIFRELNDSEGLAFALKCRSIIEYYFGNYSNYNESFIRLLEIYRELDDLEGEAAAYLLKANLEYQLGNYAKFLESIYCRFEIYQKLDNKVGIAGSTENLAWMYYL